MTITPRVIWILACSWGGGLLLAWAWWRTLRLRGSVQDRLFEPETGSLDATALQREPQGWLSRWLYLAGYRQPRAGLVFIGLTLLLGLMGGGLVGLFYFLGTVELALTLLYLVPGGVGEVFVPLVYVAAWMPLLLLAGLPALVVRSARRKRVTLVEQDLPLTLDLLATLAEAGLGLDAAIQKVVDSQPRERPLFVEFRSFQRDLLAGRSRIDALRRLSRRLEVIWFNIFISAVIQAEQIGAGLAEVLRIQADDLRSRRRERALAFAMAIPVKLLVPLVVCFLPGIFVAAIGAPFYQ
ncbi:MAG: type II secretion system F family protein, partial [Planctomycetaceae bacterium]|nr:type II secretion system F family protein [Planctomycetaceae bacterium]